MVCSVGPTGGERDARTHKDIGAQGVEAVLSGWTKGVFAVLLQLFFAFCHLLFFRRPVRAMMPFAAQGATIQR